MSLTWNVKDIEVFSDLSGEFSKSVGMLADIREQANRSIKEAEQACEDAIASLSSKRDSLRISIAQLEEELKVLQEKQADGNAVGAILDEGKISDLRKQIMTLEKALSDVEKAISECQKVSESIGDRRRVYERSYIKMRDEYEEDVSNVCKLLDKLKENLEQSLR